VYKIFFYAYYIIISYVFNFLFILFLME